MSDEVKRDGIWQGWILPQSHIDDLERMEHSGYTTAVDALAEGLRNQTRLIVDCLGITVKLAEMESWGEYECLRRKIHNGFTSTWFYELLFPRRYRRLYRAYIETKWRLLDEFLDRVLGERDI